MDPWSTENVDRMACDGTACIPQPGVPEYENGTEAQRIEWDREVLNLSSAPVRHRRPKRFQREKKPMSDPMRAYLDEKLAMYTKNVARVTVEMEKFQAEAQARLNDMNAQKQTMEQEIVKLNELLAPQKVEAGATGSSPAKEPKLAAVDRLPNRESDGIEELEAIEAD